MIRTLFVNADSQKTQCSLYENGIKYSHALTYSSMIALTYCDAHDDKDLPNFEDFDLIIWNYQDNTMRNITPEVLFSASNGKRKSMAIISDMAFNAPWFIDVHWQKTAIHPFTKQVNLSPEQVFDFMGVPDPTMEMDDERVCVLPRVCRRVDVPVRPVNMNNPIISTYGFPSIFKPIYPIVELLNAEFEEATFRIHMPTCSHQRPEFRQIAADADTESKKLAKNGIKIEYSEDWKTPDGIIHWLADSDLNILIADPKRPELTRGALPASIDNTISAQRPLAVHNSIEMRHVMEYVDPYPIKSFKEIMELGCAPTVKMYEDWSPKAFAAAFDQFIKERM